MRKFFITLLFLLILAGAGFFFGWAQFGVPPDSFGVMRSKTHGLDPQLIREGEFRWVWYKLIPTNVTITVYKPGRVERQLTFQGRLPSGDTYAAFAASTGADIQADFSYELSIDISFSLKAGSLVSLIGENSISGQAELESFQERLGRDIEAFVLRWLNNPDDNNQDEIPALLAAGSSPRLEGEIAGNFPYIENLICRIGAARFPDYRLYRQLRGLYEEYLAKQREYLSGPSEGNPERRIDSRLRLDELARYGELLTRYPILLEYLNLERNR